MNQEKQILKELKSFTPENSNELDEILKAVQWLSDVSLYKLTILIVEEMEHRHSLNS